MCRSHTLPRHHPFWAKDPILVGQKRSATLQVPDMMAGKALTLREVAGHFGSSAPVQTEALECDSFLWSAIRFGNSVLL